jgi:hypothetical protein
LYPAHVTYLPTRCLLTAAVAEKLNSSCRGSEVGGTSNRFRFSCRIPANSVRILITMSRLWWSTFQELSKFRSISIPFWDQKRNFFFSKNPCITGPPRKNLVHILRNRFRHFF